MQEPLAPVEQNKEIAVNTKISFLDTFHIFPYSATDLNREYPLTEKPVQPQAQHPTLGLHVKPIDPKMGADKAIECSCTVNHSPIYITSPLTISSASVLHCPQCGCKHTSSDYDAYHSLAMRFAMPRAAVVTMLEVASRAATKGDRLYSYKMPHKPSMDNHFELMQWERYILSQLPASANYSTGITPLNAHCTSCGTVCTITRRMPHTNNPPQYCPFCGANTLVISVDQSLFDLEQYAWECLAQKYNFPLVMVQTLYAQWHTNKAFVKCTTFDQFLATFSALANAQIEKKRAESQQ